MFKAFALYFQAGCRCKPNTTLSKPSISWIVFVRNSANYAYGNNFDIVMIKPFDADTDARSLHVMLVVIRWEF